MTTITRRTLCAVALWALCNAALSGRHAQAQERIYPMDAGLTAAGVYDASQPRPEYHTATMDPRFKTRVTRITDRNETPKGDAGTAPVGIRHHYSRIPAWNKDGSLMIVGNMYLLDGKTYDKVGIYAEYSTETFWSRVNPALMWAFRPRLSGQEPALMKTMLVKTGDTWAAGQVTTIGPFPQNHPEFPNEEIYAGGGEGRMSDDDRLLALMARTGNDLQIYVVDTTAPSGQQRVAHVSFTGKWPAGGQPDLDWVTISPSGKYILLGWKVATGRGVDAYDFTLVPGTDQQLGSPRQITTQTAHGDVCRRASGEEVWVQLLYPPLEAQFQADLAAFHLDPAITPQRLTLLPNGAIGDFPGHVSCTNFDRPGWAYVSAYPELPANVEWSPSQAFAIEIRDNQGVSGPIPVQSFASHNSNTFVPGGGNGYNYSSEPQAVVDPSGYRVMFASNWFATSTNSDIYSYVAELPNPIDIRTGTTPTGVTVSSALTQFELSRLLWQALILTTPKGTKIPATDLLFYMTSTADQADNLPAAYWLDPDPSKNISVSYSKLTTSSTGGETAVISASRSGLTKTAAVTVYPEDPLVYVVVRLVSSRPLAQIYDNQLTYFSNVWGEQMYASKVIVDNTDHTGHTALGASSAFLYFPVKNASLAILMAPALQQKIKANQVPLLYQYFDGPGSNMVIRGLTYEALAANELIEYRYAIYWNDGDRWTEIGPLAAAIRNGDHDAKFRAP